MSAARSNFAWALSRCPAFGFILAGVVNGLYPGDQDIDRRLPLEIPIGAPRTECGGKGSGSLA